MKMNSRKILHFYSTKNAFTFTVIGLCPCQAFYRSVWPVYCWESLSVVSEFVLVWAVKDYLLKIRLLNNLEYKMNKRVLFYTQIVAFYIPFLMKVT